MEFILHRMNSIKDLEEKVLGTPFGVEVDIRYHENELILEHDPFFHHEHKAELLENYLKKWGEHSGTLILNLKTEGIEPSCIKLMNKYKIKKLVFFRYVSPVFNSIYKKTKKQNFRSRAFMRSLL